MFDNEDAAGQGALVPRVPVAGSEVLHRQVAAVGTFDSRNASDFFERNKGLGIARQMLTTRSKAWSHISIGPSYDGVLGPVARNRYSQRRSC